MTDAVERLETHNEHSASILRALPLGVRLRNLAYSEQACSSPLKSRLKWRKSTSASRVACIQQNPNQACFQRNFGFEITILDLVSDLAAANIPAHDV